MQKLSFILVALLANAIVTFADLSNSTSSASASSTSSSPPSSSTTTPPSTKSLGEECTDSDVCENDAQCYAFNSTSPARCGNFKAKCTSNSQCAFETCFDGTCSGLLPVGSSCFTSDQCANGAECVFVHSSFAFCGGYGAACNSNDQCANNVCIDKTCTGLLALGSPCETSSQCDKGAICYAQNDGEPKICGNRGASCTSKDQCAWDSCIDGTCKGNLDLGAPCATSNDCAGGAQCFAPIKNGTTLCGNTDAKCTSDSQCAFNLCSSSGTCSDLYPLGSPCNSTSLCQNGAQCFGLNSTVEALCGNYGATCKDDSQCATNTCVAGFCTGTPITTPPNTVTATVTTITTLTTCPSSDICTGQTTRWTGNHGPFPCTAQLTCTCVLPGGTQTVTVCPKSVICTGQTTQWTGNSGPTSCASGVTCNNVLPSQTSKSTSIQGGGAMRVEGGAEGALLGLLLAVLGLF